MHYAYPGRKSTLTPSFTPRQNHTSIISNIRRRVRLRTVAYGAASLLFLYMLLSWNASRPRALPSGIVREPVRTKAPAGQPDVVVVTVVDESKGHTFVEALKMNRDEYARRHGYTVFMPSVREYHIGDAPPSWAKVPALRHALTVYPETPFFLFVDDHTLIANPSIRVDVDIAKKERIEHFAIKDIPVVPPDSVIKTLAEVSGDDVDFIVVQDREGLSVNSFVLRGGEWMKYFLDAWFDPLYRSYNFQKAERHALEHIVQWHGTLLSKLALFPQNILSSYTPKDRATVTKAGHYEDGNFIISFGECETNGRDCVEEMRPYFQKFHGITF